MSDLRCPKCGRSDKYRHLADVKVDVRYSCSYCYPEPKFFVESELAWLRDAHAAAEKRVAELEELNRNLEDAVRHERERGIDAHESNKVLMARVAELETALREILVGKIQSDVDHPQGEYAGMAYRFLEIAKAALIAER